MRRASARQASSVVPLSMRDSALDVRNWDRPLASRAAAWALPASAHSPLDNCGRLCIEHDWTNAWLTKSAHDRLSLGPCDSQHGCLTSPAEVTWNIKNAACPEQALDADDCLEAARRCPGDRLGPGQRSILAGQRCSTQAGQVQVKSGQMTILRCFASVHAFLLRTKKDSYL